MRVERILDQRGYPRAWLVLGDSEQWCDTGRFQKPTAFEHEISPWHEISVVADPPYGVQILTDMAGVKRSKAASATGKSFKPVIGNDRPFDPTRWLGFGVDQLLWGANHYCSRLPEAPGRWLNWDKRCDIIPPRCQADCELAWSSEYGAARTFYHYWDGMVKASEMGEPREHPTQKPVALMRWCMQYAKGKVILDPYMGSGTTGVAAIQEGRNFIGFELDEEYFKVAAKRIRQAVTGYTPDMFAQGMTA